MQQYQARKKCGIGFVEYEDGDIVPGEWIPEGQLQSAIASGMIVPLADPGSDQSLAPVDPIETQTTANKPAK